MIQVWSRLVATIGERRFLLVIALLTFVLQLAFRGSATVYGEPYIIAKNLVAGKGFVYLYPLTPHEAVTCYATPLFAFIQAAILWSGLGNVGIQILNLLLLQAACFVIFRFFKSVVESRALALAIYTAVSFYIPFWILAYALEPDSLNLLLIVLTVERVFMLSNRPQPASTFGKDWWIFGLLCGLQILVRPDILLGASLLGIWLLIRAKAWRWKCAKGLLLSAVVALGIVSPWTVRNYIAFHRFVLVSANAGYNLYVGNNPVATGEFSISPSESQQEVDREAQIRNFSESHDQVDVDRLRFEMATDWIVAHPIATIKLDLKKFSYHWLGREFIGAPSHFDASSLLLPYRILTIALLIFGVIGWFVVRDSNLRGLVLAVALYSTLVSMIFFVQSRHRTLKVDPFLVPLATIGVFYLLDQGKREIQRKTTE